jgi:hypothetical protein
MAATNPVAVDPNAGQKHVRPDRICAYHWPTFSDPAPPLPTWLAAALSSGDLRVSDDLGHIRTPEGELTISPGDWVVKSDNGLYAVWSDNLYHAFLKSTVDRSFADAPAQSTAGVDKPPRPLSVDEASEFDPTAERADEGAHAAHDAGAEFGPADPHNAQVEGVDLPDDD